jgi:signal transduction histidine kinase
MPLELTELAAGFPLAASFAIAGGITAMREGRRRSALNEAVHELRRPFQVLALSLPEDTAADERVDASLRMAAAAIDRLERAINGEGEIEGSAPVPLPQAVAPLVERWQVLAEHLDRPLQLRWKAGEAMVCGSRNELAQTVDNLISNAFEHGSGPVVVEARVEDGFLRLVVRDAGPGAAAPPRAGAPRIRERFSGRARHGHGLRVVRRAAARHGGRFRLRRSGGGTEAVLELPMMGLSR